MLRRAIIFLSVLFVIGIAFAQEDTCILRIEKIQNPKNKALAFNEAALRTWETGEYQKSLFYSKKGLDICSSNSLPAIEASLLNNRGIAYDYIGNYTLSLKCFFEALPIQEKLKDSAATAEILSNIGLVYMRQNLAEKALSYHFKALKINKSLKSLHGISVNLNNIAILYVGQKKYKEAIDYYEQCIQIDKKLNDERALGDDYNNIGLCFTDMMMYDVAHKYLELALEIRIKQDDRLGICETYNNFAAIFQNQSNWKEAEKYYRLSLPLAKEIGSKESLRYIYDNLHKVASNLNKMEDAYEFHKLYVVYKDSLEDINNLRIQAEQELNYKNEKENEKLRILQAQKDERFRIILISVIVIAITFLLFSFTLYRRWKKSQLQQKLIAEKTLLVEQKNHDILDSITYARRIQTAILPSEAFIKEHLPESFISYIPKDIVAGDFYWLEENKGNVLFAVADCTGHGVPGAMMSVICSNALNRALYEFNIGEPNHILNKTRKLIVNDLSKNNNSVYDGMDISLCLINRDEKKIKWSGANNPLWIYRSETKNIEVFKPNKQSIGKHLNEAEFIQHEISLKQKDRVYMFTDGYADQFGGLKNKKIMVKQFKLWVLETSELSLEEQKIELENRFFIWKGEYEQIDDVCLIGFQL